MAHARLGPSNHRWPHCPGSVREEAGYEDVAGASAIDGTGSHLLLELCLINGVRAETYDGHIIGENDPENPNGWLVDIERVQRVQQCLDYVSRRHRELSEQFPNGQVVITAEQESNPGKAYGRDDWWGTCDITIMVFVGSDVVFIEVCDYKDGRGYVSVKDKSTGEYNSQLVSYMGGRLVEYLQPKLPREMFTPYDTGKLQGCRLSIVQPKTNPAVRYEDLQASTLLGELDKLARAADQTDDPNAPLTFGKHCQWCKANPKRGGHCTAESTNTLEVVKSMNDVIATDGQSLFETISQSISKLNEMTPEQLSQLADVRSSMMTVFDSIEKEIVSRIDAGEKVPGYAMKPGRASRVWAKDEEEIVKVLKARRFVKDEIYPPKLASPAQVMKSDKLTAKQKADIEEKYITEKAGALKLTKVAHGDEKEPTEMFADVIQENVVQSNTNVVQSNPKSIFDEQPQPNPEEFDFF